jgi:hypothetical protein
MNKRKNGAAACKSQSTVRFVAKIEKYVVESFKVHRSRTWLVLRKSGDCREAIQAPESNWGVLTEHLAKEHSKFEIEFAFDYHFEFWRRARDFSSKTCFESCTWGERNIVPLIARGRNLFLFPIWSQDLSKCRAKERTLIDSNSIFALQRLCLDLVCPNTIIVNLPMLGSIRMESKDMENMLISFFSRSDKQIVSAGTTNQDHFSLDSTATIHASIRTIGNELEFNQ